MHLMRPEDLETKKLRGALSSHLNKDHQMSDLITSVRYDSIAGQGRGGTRRAPTGGPCSSFMGRPAGQRSSGLTSKSRTQAHLGSIL